MVFSTNGFHVVVTLGCNFSGVSHTNKFVVFKLCVDSQKFELEAKFDITDFLRSNTVTSSVASSVREMDVAVASVVPLLVYQPTSAPSLLSLAVSSEPLRMDTVSDKSLTVHVNIFSGCLSTTNCTSLQNLKLDFPLYDKKHSHEVQFNTAEGDVRICTEPWVSGKGFFIVTHRCV